MASISSSLIFSKEEILKAPFIQHLRPSSYTTPRLVMAALEIIEWILVHTKNSFYFWFLIRIGPCKPHHNLDVVGVLPTSELNLGVSFSWGWSVCVKLLRFLFPTVVSVLKLYWKGHLSLKSRGFPILHLTLELDKKLREREGWPWVSCRHCPSPCKCPPWPWSGRLDVDWCHKCHMKEVSHQLLSTFVTHAQIVIFNNRTKSSKIQIFISVYQYKSS